MFAGPGVPTWDAAKTAKDVSAMDIRVPAGLSEPHLQEA